MKDAVQLCLAWESEVVREVLPSGENSVRVIARRPLSEMSVNQAAKVLGTTPHVVRDLYQARILRGFKPGARTRRKDGRRSNARLVLDSESVLRHKHACRAEG